MQYSTLLLGIAICFALFILKYFKIRVSIEYFPSNLHSSAIEYNVKKAQIYFISLVFCVQTHSHVSKTRFGEPSILQGPQQPILQLLHQTASNDFGRQHKIGILCRQ